MTIRTPRTHRGRRRRCRRRREADRLVRDHGYRFAYEDRRGLGGQDGWTSDARSSRGFGLRPARRRQFGLDRETSPRGDLQDPVDVEVRRDEPLMSSIFSRSAAWVLTSRSWTSDATV